MLYSTQQGDTRQEQKGASSRCWLDRTRTTIQQIADSPRGHYPNPVRAYLGQIRGHVSRAKGGASRFPGISFYLFI